jgi:hypothetical protein
MSLNECLVSCLDDVLGIRDDIGAIKQPVFIITRTWSGEAPGDGTKRDTEKQVLPTPMVVDLSHSLRILEGGAVKRGDLILKMISKNQFPLESEVDGKSPSRNVEKFYRVGEAYYQVISVTEDYAWWNVQIRRVAFSGR